MKRFGTAVPLYRHESDRVGRDCGRACMQMVISALHLGRRTPAAIAATPVPVTQEGLASLETSPLDPGPGGWMTFPDELVAVLNQSPQLRQLGLDHWRVASHTASAAGLEALLDDIAAPLQTDGIPAILSLKDPDHWVVVPSVWQGASGHVTSVQFVDPAGWAHAPEQHHTYKDNCELSGRDYWVRDTPTGLADRDLEIGNTQPLDYQGKYVAIVHGPGQRRRPRPAGGLPPRIPTPAPSHSSSELVAASLRDIAADLGLAELKALLDLSPQIRVWLVKDMAHSNQEYSLATVSHPHDSYGAVCVCNAATKQVGQFTLSTRSEAWDTLNQIPDGETLWWYRDQRSEVWQPQFPFRLEASTTGPRYRRLIDNVVIQAL